MSGSCRKVGVPDLGVLIIRILLFKGTILVRVPYLGCHVALRRPPSSLNGPVPSSCNAGAVEEKLALADDDGGVVCREAENLSVALRSGLRPFLVI